MDNQKSQTGNGSNINKDGSGSSMGKDLNKDSGNHMGGTGGMGGMGGNKNASGLDSSKQFDSSKSSDFNKSSDLNKGNDQLGAAKTNNAFDSKSMDSNKSMDTNKSAEFPKAGMPTAPASDSTKGAGMTAADAHKSIDKALDAAQPMADRLASTAHSSVDKVSSALTDGRARMEDKTKQLTEAYEHFAATGREYVRSSPATSVLVALAAGYTLSKLLGRR
ncbi:hypothetical protein KY495_13415 [Massilia sp. PAMC28688]|uniref:DUF883 family protein n=1 Tax=Massilia sp. PAMC28688 TaxID=2861283 RepID=UPI001C630452|nr:hypothetical protein [Massilia sp. PAMC28688]QYF91794.1 hypothetical protein KY495_13415 [Massilia sp. PAMC28688]